MPTAAEIRENAQQVTARLHAFTNQSMQQVSSLASRGARFVQHRFIAFSDTCRGRKSEDAARDWTTSERNSQSRNSSKDKADWKAHVEIEEEKSNFPQKHAFQSFTWIFL